MTMPNVGPGDTVVVEGHAGPALILEITERGLYRLQLKNQVIDVQGGDLRPTDVKLSAASQRNVRDEAVSVFKPGDRVKLTSPDRTLRKATVLETRDGIVTVVTAEGITKEIAEPGVQVDSDHLEEPE